MPNPTSTLPATLPLAGTIFTAADIAACSDALAKVLSGETPPSAPTCDRCDCCGEPFAYGRLKEDDCGASYCEECRLEISKHDPWRFL